MRFLLVFIGLTRLAGLIYKRMAKSFSAILMAGTALTTFQATSQVTSDCWNGIDCPVEVSFEGSVCTPENCWCGPTRFPPQGAQGRVRINVNLRWLQLPEWVILDKFVLDEFGIFSILTILPNFGSKREGTLNFVYETNLGTIRSCMFHIVQLGVNDDGNDTPEYATLINNGQKLRASIKPLGDVDWYRFRIKARSWVHVELKVDEGDTEVWLYGPDSFTKLVAYDDNSETRFSPRIVRTNETALLPGTYHVKVGESGNNNSIDSYEITVTWGPDDSDHPRLLRPEITQEKRFQFTINGLTNQLWVVEHSTNLALWIPRSTNSSFSGRIVYLDSAHNRGSINFYRVVAYER